MTKPQFFSDQLKFRKWLEKNHNKKDELLLGYYKKSSGKPSITWEESVDEALMLRLDRRNKKITR